MRGHEIGHCPICNQPAERYDFKKDVPKEMKQCDENEYYLCFQDKDFPNRRGVIRTDAR